MWSRTLVLVLEGVGFMMWLGIAWICLYAFLWKPKGGRA